MTDKNNNDVKENEFISEDREKLNSFYKFSMNKTKFENVKVRANKFIWRFALTGFIFGFFT
jgi:hypothetical protein